MSISASMVQLTTGRLSFYHSLHDARGFRVLTCARDLLDLAASTFKYGRSLFTITFKSRLEMSVGPRSTCYRRGKHHAFFSYTNYNYVTHIMQVYNIVPGADPGFGGRGECRAKHDPSA